MSQPGVLEVEFTWPQVVGTIVYDSSKISGEQMVAIITEKSKRDFVVINDQPLQ